MKTTAAVLSLFIFMGIEQQLKAQTLFPKQDEKSELYGFAVENENGESKYVIQPKYNYAADFYMNRAAVEKNQKMGFVNTKGKEIIPLKYETVCDFQDNGLACAQLNGKYGIIDTTGKTILPFDYESIEKFSDGLYSAKKNGMFGAIDIKNQTIIPFEYEKLSGFCCNGLARAKKGGKTGVINKSNQTVVSFKYDDITTDGYFFAKQVEEGLLVVKLNNLIGYVNLKGEEVIAPQYETHSYGGCFKDGFALVKKGGKFGVINKSNKVIIPFKYDEWAQRVNNTFTFKEKAGGPRVDVIAK